MWRKGWRDEIWDRLDTHFDIIVIGGGITGAGILREAAQMGYKALLVEANDFASGTSSRSSKLVHGGLRYLKNFQFKTTFESVIERQNLLKHGKGLVNHLDIFFTSYEGDHTPPWQMGLGLIIYGVMAGRWQYKRLSANKIKNTIPYINEKNLAAAFPYYDAQTDDARLTLRVLQEAVEGGGLVINYTKAETLIKDKRNLVCGIIAKDQDKGRDIEITADLVISATGAWADELRSQIGQNKKLRPLRGSHLVFPQERLPLPFSVSVNHPRDGRPVFAFPWEGVTLVGTTDVDNKGDIPDDPKISQEEAEYLMEFVQFAFPSRELESKDVITTWSGIRPVVNTGKANPSKESREHAIWFENGLLTVTGGKLTTFGVMAQDAMREAVKHLGKEPLKRNLPVLSAPPRTGMEHGLDPVIETRFYGRYGKDAPQLLENIASAGQEMIEPTPYFWHELEWAVNNEGIVHLDDLLLRRIRIGLLLPNNGIHLLPKIRSMVQNKLGWSDKRWMDEVDSYTTLTKSAYSLPEG